MWKNAYVGVYQLLNWKMHGETLNFEYPVNLDFAYTDLSCNNLKHYAVERIF